MPMDRPDWTLAHVQSADGEAIAALLCVVIAAQPALSPSQRATLQAHALANLAWWQAQPDPAEAGCHLLARGPAGEAIGVVLVRAHWNLCSLFVAPAWQRRGLGRALVQAAWQSCRGRTDRPLLRLNAAPGAAGFYARLGFREVRSLQALPAGFVSLGRPLAGPAPEGAGTEGLPRRRRA